MSRPADDKTKQLIISTYFLIRYFRMRGHELANLDPLSKHCGDCRSEKLRIVWKDLCEKPS